jgi:hypothetical protein
LKIKDEGRNEGKDVGGGPPDTVKNFFKENKLSSGKYIKIIKINEFNVKRREINNRG